MKSLPSVRAVTVFLIVRVKAIWLLDCCLYAWLQSWLVGTLGCLTSAWQRCRIRLIFESEFSRELLNVFDYLIDLHVPVVIRYFILPSSVACFTFVVFGETTTPLK